MIVFTEEQLSLLRAEWDVVNRIDPASKPYQALIKFLNGLSQAQLKQLADARIKIVSGLALNRIPTPWLEFTPKRKKRKLAQQREIVLGNRRFIYEQESSRQWSGYFDDNHAITYVERTKRELLDDAMCDASARDAVLKGDDIDGVRAVDRVLS